jgi:hypothetical protein
VKFTTNLKGAEKLSRKLRDLQRRAKKIEGTNQIPLTELFQADFLHKYTNFSSPIEMEAAMDKAGFSTESQADWNRIPQNDLDAFAAQHTRFTSW